MSLVGQRVKGWGVIQRGIIGVFSGVSKGGFSKEAKTGPRSV
jgi:hypothetical protein